MIKINIASSLRAQRSNPESGLPRRPVGLLAMTVLMFLTLLISGCIKEEWVGVVYYKGNNPLHIGTFSSFEECRRVTGYKAEGMGEFYEGTCLRNCNYDFLLGQDVCKEAIDI
ncbi:MAG: hypothetical protein H6868_06605 [Rhodospirillales bacterium]|nr:hypothetical protein [Rhodospirillales bacterium]